MHNAKCSRRVVLSVKRYALSIERIHALKAKQSIMSVQILEYCTADPGAIGNNK